MMKLEIKKKNLKIFFISFILIYGIISILCLISKQPLVFAYGYNFFQFLTLFIILGLLSFSLILVMEYLEKMLKKFSENKRLSAFAVYAYFIFISAFGLFAFTVFAGFAESGLPFFYYGCVTNSCIYLLGGYVTTFIVSVYFAHRFLKNST
ncbi:MAG: hypothetical protein HN392_04235 [Anaerolineae bacterium]|jgi:hypothetical protein|nr:hypothetical protein [Anaerolineae bacterium]MBT7781923.1 hypothetical protein [Anaerolineae bacterium]